MRWAGTLSKSRTCQSARAKTIAHARPIRPPPIIAALVFIGSHPEDLPAQVEIFTQRGRGSLMHDRAALEHIRAIGQGQHEIEIMLDDDHRDLPAQAVEGLEQFLDDRGCETLERLVEQQHPDVARQRARHRDHLLFAAGEEIRWRVESRGELRKEMQDLVVGPRYTVALAAFEAPKLEVMAHAHAGK